MDRSRDGKRSPDRLRETKEKIKDKKVDEKIKRSTDTGSRKELRNGRSKSSSSESSESSSSSNEDEVTRLVNKLFHTFMFCYRPYGCCWSVKQLCCVSCLAVSKYSCVL